MRAKFSSYVESVCDFSTRIWDRKNNVSTTEYVDTKNPFKNYITLIIVNTYADEYYGSTAHKCKGLILPERSGMADA